MRLESRVIALFAFVLLVGACAPRNGTDPTAETQDTTWTGEVIEADDEFTFRPCGREKGMPMRGPAMDSLKVRYRALSIQEGQRMMAWITGHTVVSDPVPADSFFHAVSLGHIDALRMCPLSPLPRLAGRYGTTLVEHLGNRQLTIDLYTNGTVLQLTQMRGQSVPFEQEGHWGVDGTGVVEVDLGQSFPKAYYTVTGDTLIRIASLAGVKGSRFTLVRSGAPDPNAGVRGSVIQWLNSIATDRCAPIDRSSTTSSTALTALFPDPSSWQALADSAVTWLPMDTLTQHIGAPGTATVGDLVTLKRRALLLRP